ncbi:hypothetical protein CI109_102817 [Kwoniella shandongensis]|uniref:Uncharacterized protein n=1 Tax=Kwoniella shandongensis TaxID=1734106 RepID=A0A5M6C978_9TREE|nr:uncharacterized protein CI109_000008 [Kwoniella shandongensis]KAA5531170.1 hypothetical protein CI109_000008 [Kwoniella shandongensis]
MSSIQLRQLPPRTNAPAPTSSSTTTAATRNRPPATPLMKIERQYKKFLAKRYMSFIWRVGVWTSSVLCTFVILIKGFSAELYSTLPFTVLLSIPVFISLAFLLRVRKSYITKPYRPSPQQSLPKLLISSFWNERAVTLLFSYALFSLAISNVWLTLVGEGQRLFSPTARHPWQLNERRVVLCASNLGLFLLLAARDILQDRLQPVWPVKKIPFARAVQSALFDDLTMSNFLSETGTFGLTMGWSLAIPIIYKILLRGWVWKWVNFRLWAIFLRPFLGSFARPSIRAPGAWSLLPQLAVLDLVSLAVVQFPIKGLMAYVTQPIHFEDFYKKSPLSQERYLIVALQSQDSYYLQFTLMELLRNVHIPLRRKALFDDISKSPTLTTELWQELLLQLGRVHSTLVSRGAPSSSSTASRPATARPSAPDPRAIPVRQGDIFRPITKQRSTFGLKAVLDGPIRSAPPEPVVKVTQAGALAVKRVEAVQDQVMGRIEATPVGGAIVGEAKGLRKGVYDWAGKEWAKRNMRIALADMLIAQRIIEIITTLAVASIEEDTYGHVQQVLPATLEAIIRFRSAILGLESQLSYQAGVLGGAQGGATAQVQNELGAARKVCENAIRRIGEKFGQSLGAFRFPPAIAHSLGEICKAA